MNARIKKYGGAGCLLASGLVAGGLMSGTFTANAASSPTPSAPPGITVPGDVGDQARGPHPGEQLLTGATAAKVKAAALAKYPGATVERVETDRDGGYEAHLVTANGVRHGLEISRSFVVTGDHVCPPGAPGMLPPAGDPTG